jgi:hypothetical protein
MDLEQEEVLKLKTRFFLERNDPDTTPLSRCSKKDSIKQHTRFPRIYQYRSMYPIFPYSVLYTILSTNLFAYLAISYIYIYIYMNLLYTDPIIYGGIRDDFL